MDQAYIPLNVNVDSADYSPTTGQLLSPLGTVIPLQNGPASDQFFLTFAQIGTHTHTYTTPTPSAPTPVDLPAVVRYRRAGLRRGQRLMAKLTTVSPTTPAVNTTYLTVQTGLPTVFNIQSVSSGAQIASAQLAMQYCQALVNDPTLGPAFFPGMNFNAAPGAALRHQCRHGSGGAAADQQSGRARISRTQPTDCAVSTELYSLIDDADHGCGRRRPAPRGPHADHHHGGLHRRAVQRHDADQIACHANLRPERPTP